MTDDVKAEPLAKHGVDSCKTCSDHDEDCEDLPDKVGCWLYAPEKGMCPYLREETPQ